MTHTALSIRDAVRMTILPTHGEHRLSVASIANHLAVSVSLVYQWAEGSKDIPMRYVLPLTHYTGCTLIIEALCYAARGRYVPDSTDRDAVTEILPELMHCSANTVQTVVDAQRDGKLTDDEKANIRRCAHDLHRRAAELESLTNHVPARNGAATLAEAEGVRG